METGEYHVLARVEGSHWWFRQLHRQAIEAMKREAQRVGRPLRVFDAGCGTGGLLAQVCKQPWVELAAGCEPHPVALEHCRGQKLRVWGCSIEALPEWKPPLDLDVVLCMDVLYHRDVNPWQSTAVMTSLLRPGGLMVINVAAMPCLRRDHDSRVHGARRFLARELRNLVQSHGLDVERLHYWNSWLTPLLWLKLQLADRAAHRSNNYSELEPPHNGLNAFLNGLLRLEHLVNRWAPLPFGSSLFCQARKYR